MLASEYGWSKREILEETYIDELFLLSKKINKRKAREYLMELAIVSNPHTKKPKELYSMLRQLESDETQRTEEFDDVGFDRLKSALRMTPHFVVK